MCFVAFLLQYRPDIGLELFFEVFDLFWKTFETILQALVAPEVLWTHLPIFTNQNEEIEPLALSPLAKILPPVGFLGVSFSRYLVEKELFEKFAQYDRCLLILLHQ